MTRAQNTFRIALRAVAGAGAVAGFLFAGALTVVLITAAVAGMGPFTALIYKIAVVTIGAVLVLMLINIVFKVREERSARRVQRELSELRIIVAALSREPPDPGARSKIRPYLGHAEQLREATDDLPEPSRARVIEFLRKTQMTGDLEREAMYALRKWRRVRAALLLGWLRSAASVPVLAANLDEDDADIAMSAAEALAYIADPQAYRALLGALRAGRQPRIRLAELIEVSPAANTLPFFKELAGTENPEVRYWVAYLLRKKEGEGFTSLLLEFCSDPDSNVRARAVESLGETGGAPTEVLRRLLKDDVWYVRAQAATAVGRCGASDLTTDLLALLRDSRWWVRQDAAQALERLGQSVVHAVEGMLNDPDRFARNKAAEILGKLGVVERNVTDLMAPARAPRARKFLLAVGRAEAVSTLHDEFERASAARKIALAEVLGEIGDPRSLPVLRAASETDDADLARAARAAAERIAAASPARERAVNE